MTEIIQKLNEDLKQSMRERNELKTSTLRLLLSAIKYAEFRKQDVEFNKHPEASDLKQITLTDADILGVIAKEIKQREDSIEAYTQGRRQDLADKEAAEMAILKTYLPQQLSREEILSEVKQVVAETGARGPADKGKVMSKLVARLKGKADGKEINNIVTELLNSM